MKRQLFLISALVLFLLVSHNTCSAHTTNRIFPMLERSDAYVIKDRSRLDTTLFYINASTAEQRGGGSGGIPELWGRYDLKDVIASLQVVNPAADPVNLVTGSDALSGKSIKFRVRGTVRGYGATLNYERDLKFCGMQVGVTLPVMSVQTTSRFEFDRANSDPIFNNPAPAANVATYQDLAVDKIRRRTHQLIGFEGNEWSKSGFGDLDVHLRWSKNLDHACLMQSINLNIQLGMLMPTGILSDTKVPVSVSVGNNGHWGVYNDFAAEFELKQDLTVGFIFGLTHLAPHTRTLRLSVGNEPTIFSALVAPVQVTPALTYKISPYLILGNLTDGLDLQVRYTYLRHNVDHWVDHRNNPTPPSYLEGSGALIPFKEYLSMWRAHYGTIQLTYDTKEAQKEMKLEPKFVIGYDMPIVGYGIAKTHQLNIGVQLHF